MNLFRRTPFVLIIMALGLLLFYSGTPPLVARLAGLLLFGVCALLRPELGLLFVPLTAPLYLIPASLSGLRASEILLPLHEVTLLITLGTTLVQVAWQHFFNRSPQKPLFALFGLNRGWLAIVLFLLAGIWGAVIALPEARSEALREFRWLIVEPLLFFLLVQFFLYYAEGEETLRGASPHAPLTNTGEGHYQQWIIGAFLVSGSIVALLGLLQFAGVDLVPLLGKKQSFSKNVVPAGGMVRVASVYGHPNNLGLFLGRVWPLAAALALMQFRRARTVPAGNTYLYFLLVSALLCLGGIAVSFSRGAWLGAVAAGAVLGVGVLIGRENKGGHPVTRSPGQAWSPGLLLGVALLAVIGGLALTLRGGVSGGSADVRVLLWREALAYIQLHPLGIGLDQFLYYHHPQYGRSLIDPALLGTSEEWAAHPHNLLLDIWLRLGPLGLGAFSWLLVRFFRSGMQNLRSTTPNGLVLGALAAMTAALVHGLVDQFYFVPDLAIAFWLLIAFVQTQTQEQLRTVRYHQD